MLLREGGLSEPRTRLVNVVFASLNTHSFCQENANVKDILDSTYRGYRGHFSDIAIVTGMKRTRSKKSNVV